MDERPKRSGCQVMILYLFGAAILLLIGIVVGGVWIGPSIAVQSVANKQAVLLIATTMPFNTGVTDTVPIDYLAWQTAEQNRHNEEMQRQALDAVVSVAKSGDTAQTTMAVGNSVGNTVMGISMTVLCIALLLFPVWLPMLSKLTKKGGQEDV